jgi:hypothetical protein
MISTRVRRITTVAATGAAALGVGVALAVAPASAATAPAASVRPLASSGCAGDACISLTTPSGGKVSVHAWAYDAEFYGHFEVTGPDGLLKNSPTSGAQWFYAGGSGPTWSVNAVVGQYCVTAWKYYGGQTTSLGRACENVE